MSGNNWLSVDELCRILDGCGKNGVKEIRITKMGVTATFGNADQPSQMIQLPNQAVIMDKIPASEELEAKEDRMARLMIEDPSEYERLVSEGELDGKET